MRKLNGLIVGCTLALFAGTASAQSNTVDIILTDSANEQMVIPNASISSIQVLPKSGQVLISLNEDWVIEPATVCEVDCDPPPPTTAVITSFAATSPIVEGEATVLTWATTDANSCSAASGPGDWTSRTLGTQGTGTSVVIATAGSYTFAINCVGDDEVVKTRTANVTVDSAVADPQTNCTTPPLGSGVEATWNNVWGVEFPGPSNKYRTPVVPYSSYLAIEFNTGTVLDNGYLGNLESTRTAGLKQVAYSECPGDFDVVRECRISWGLGGYLEWATNGKAGACQLDQNKTYYINITFTDGEDSNSSTCDGVPCEIILRHLNF